MFLTRMRSADMADRSPFGGFWFEPLGLRTSTGANVTSSTAMMLPGVYACVNVLAKSFALMQFMLYEPQEKDGRTKRTKRVDHWMYRLIRRAPNRFQSPFEWRLMLMGHLALRGNAFCQIVEDGNGKITELLPLHPDRMRVELLASGNYRYRYRTEDGREIIYLRSEIWHLRWMSADGIVGVSPIELAREAIGEGLSMQSYSARFFANDARPGGWIEYDGRFSTDEARKTFKESWQQNYSGANVRKVAVLEKGMKYHELALNDADTQFVTARGRNLADIARIFGVPPHKIGDLSRSTNNNIEHQSIEFWNDTMWPWAEMWESSIEFFLLGPDSGLDAEFDHKPMMRGDGAARATRIRSLVLSGVMMRNEGREEEGYDPVDGLDEPLAPLNMGTVNADGEIEAPEAPESGAAPGGGPDDGSGERLSRILEASAGRLARRAAGTLAKKGAAETFGDEFTVLMAEAFGVSEARAATWTAKMRGAQTHTEESIRRSLLACALGA